ncbi:SH3 domain-containing protein [Rhizobium sp. Root1220]|uniref:SH3 domain-containing protein n=1 Tax=Rhizobium sp. Root1220 TaxID=1736432 RepID=UPI0012E3EAFF|nr:SH3 domain-containing protein [Rhizobium sp. Root1220]
MTIAAAAALLLAPAMAQAAEGFATANVNMRAGPSTQYPAVTVIPAGESVEIHGCLADVPWCDVEFYGGRGWVAGRYVQALYQQRRVYVGPDYYRPLGIPTVVFSVGNYWDRYYRNRDFYRERDRWRRNPAYDRPAVGRPYRGPEFDRGPARPQPDTGGRPGFDRGPDRGPEGGRGPDRRPDLGAQPGQRPDPGREPGRRPDMQGRPDDNRRPDFNRDRNRPDVQRPPQRSNDANQDRRGGDRRRPPCAPGDAACGNNR